MQEIQATGAEQEGLTTYRGFGPEDRNGMVDIKEDDVEGVERHTMEHRR